MFLEIPNMAMNQYDKTKQKIISKSFRKFLERHETQIFIGKKIDIIFFYINI